jgi:hypothetical protein
MTSQDNIVAADGLERVLRCHAPPPPLPRGRRPGRRPGRRQRRRGGRAGEEGGWQGLGRGAVVAEMGSFSTSQRRSPGVMNIFPFSILYTMYTQDDSVIS